MTEGANDGGIDAVYTFLDNRLVEDEHITSIGDEAQIWIEIIQAKNEYGFKELAVQKLTDHLPLLLSLDPTVDLKDEFNERLLERFELFRRVVLAARFPKLSVRVRYVTKSADPANIKAKKKAERLRAALTPLLGDCDARVDFLGAPELNLRARKRQFPTLRLQASAQPIAGDKGGIVCLVSLKEWYDFVRDDEDSLRESIFEENVRGFAGNTRINRSIAESLHQGDEGLADFWWLNNGVTVLGSRVRLSYKTLTIEDPQIVNGLQTSRSIFQYFNRKADTIAADGTKRQLLVRVIEASDDALSSQIIQATNSQNKVDSISLRATEPLQRSIEEFFGQMGYYYERKKNEHKNNNKPRERIVEVLEVAQAMAAILLCEPHVSRGRPSALVREPRYERIFNSKVPQGAYLNTTLIVRQVEHYLSTQNDLSRQGRGNIRFQLARAASAFALSSSTPKALQVSHLDPTMFTNTRLDPIYEWLLERRNAAEHASNVTDPNVLAKSAEWSRQIDDGLNYFSHKNRWPTALTEPWRET